MQKIILIISLALNFLFLSVLTAFTVKKGGVNYIFNKIESVLSSDDVEGNQFTAKYKGRKSIFEVLPEGEDDIIFLGCSLTEHGQWNELFNNPRIKNRGIGGDETRGVLNRIDNIIASKPKKIFVKVGINDLRQNVPLDSIVSNFKKIVAAIKEKSPSTEIFLKSVLPVNNKDFRVNIKNENVIKLNQSIRQIADDNQLVYINLHSHFANLDSQLIEEYTFDGIHLNGRGYLLWKSVIEEYVH